MSQLEQNFKNYLCSNPEIEHCYQIGLINRRSLARHLIQNKIGDSYQIEALIAMIRRFDFKKIIENKIDFSSIKINIKDNIIILDFIKELNLVKELQNLVNSINYDKGDTLKIVVGTSNVKLFIDKENEYLCDSLIKKYKLKNKQTNLSEISLLFSENSKNTKGIISTLTKHFVINNITISEMLTSTPEILFYLKEEYIMNAYQVIKTLKTQK